MADDKDGKDDKREIRYIDTGGGAYNEGEIGVEGGDFVGRDRSGGHNPAPGFRA